ASGTDRAAAPGGRSAADAAGTGTAGAADGPRARHRRPDQADQAGRRRVSRRPRHTGGLQRRGPRQTGRRGPFFMPAGRAAGATSAVLMTGSGSRARTTGNEAGTFSSGAPTGQIGRAHV